jgi:hypothetical protein
MPRNSFVNVLVQLPQTAGRRSQSTTTTIWFDRDGVMRSSKKRERLPHWARAEPGAIDLVIGVG